MENTESKQIDIIHIIGLLNNKETSRKQISKEYGIADKRLTSLINENGYEYNQKSRKYEPIGNKVDGTKVTYRIPTELYQAIKLQAIFEGVNATELVIKALEQYIPNTTKEVVKQNRK